MDHMDSLRKLLLQEPRGYPCQNANVILPSSIPGWVGIVKLGSVYTLINVVNYLTIELALHPTGAPLVSSF